MQAVEYLNQLKEIDKKIEIMQEKKRELWAAATSTTANNNGMPHASGVSDKVGNFATKIAAVSEEINALVDEYVDTKRDIIAHIRQLPKKQREVLRWLYVEKRANPEPGQLPYFTWAEVANKLRCSEQNIAEVRKRAVKNLQKILEIEANSDKTPCIE